MSGKVSGQTKEPSSSGAWHTIPSSLVQLLALKADWCLLAGSCFHGYFKGGEGVRKRAGRRNILPFIISLCYLLVLQGVCGSLPPEMCNAWYGGG